MKKIIGYDKYTQSDENPIVENNSNGGLTEKQIHRKLLDILFQSNGELDLENKLEENGFDKRYTNDLLSGCERTAWVINIKRQMDDRSTKMEENESKFVKAFVDFVNDKIDTDFPNIQFVPENCKTREEKLIHNAKWLYNCHTTAFSRKDTILTLYIKKGELYISFGGSPDKRFKSKNYDMMSIIEIIENRRK